MESSRRKKCPDCSSDDVFDTGNRAGSDEGMSFGDIFSSLAHPIYRCNHCHKSFVYLDHYRDKGMPSDDDTIGGLPA